MDRGYFQLLAAADGHRALSGRVKVRKKWGWAVHIGWLLPRQGGWSCGRLPRSIKCRSYDLQGWGGFEYGMLRAGTGGSSPGTVAAGEVGK